MFKKPSCWFLSKVLDLLDNVFTRELSSYIVNGILKCLVSLVGHRVIGSLSNFFIRFQAIMLLWDIPIYWLWSARCHKLIFLRWMGLCYSSTNFFINCCDETESPKNEFLSTTPWYVLFPDRVVVFPVTRFFLVFGKYRPFRPFDGNYSTENYLSYLCRNFRIAQ